MSHKEDKFRDWDAAYVLGSLSTEDRREFEGHLAGCPVCTNAVADFAGLPGFLMKLDAASAVSLLQLPVPSNVLALHLEPIQKLALAAMKQKSSLRRRMVAGLSVAAAFVMVIGLLVGSSLQPDSIRAIQRGSAVTTGTKIAMIAMEKNAMVVDMRLTAKKWGSQFSWTCLYSSDAGLTTVPQSYELVVTDASGVTTTVATWSQSGSSAKGLVASTGIPATQIKSIEVRYLETHAPIVRGEI